MTRTPAYLPTTEPTHIHVLSTATAAERVAGEYRADGYVVDVEYQSAMRHLSATARRDRWVVRAWATGGIGGRA